MEAIPPAWRCAWETTSTFSIAAPASACWDSTCDRSSTADAISAHVFVSHFHWDHIQGFPFFGRFMTNRTIAFMFHCSSRTRSLKRVLEEQMAAPYFPVGLTEMQAHQNFYDMEEGRISLDEMVTCRLCGSTIPRAAWASGWKPKKASSCMPPTTSRATRMFDKNVRKLAAGADVLIYDAQYLPDEYAAAAAAGDTATGAKPSTW